MPIVVSGRKLVLLGDGRGSLIKLAEQVEEETGVDEIEPGQIRREAFDRGLAPLPAWSSNQA